MSFVRMELALCIYRRAVVIVPRMKRKASNSHYINEPARARCGARLGFGTRSEGKAAKFLLPREMQFRVVTDRAVEPC